MIERTNQAASSIFKPYLLIRRMAMMEHTLRTFIPMYENPQHKQKGSCDLEIVVCQLFFMMLTINYFRQRIMQMLICS